MSNNFFLHLKTIPCPSCGKPDIEDDRIHIGHSAGGWVFLWKGYRGVDSPPARTIESATDWYEYLAQQINTGGAEIKDSYGTPWTLPQLISYVVGKRTSGSRNSDADRSPERPITPVGGDDIAYHEFS